MAMATSSDSLLPPSSESTDRPLSDNASFRVARVSVILPRRISGDNGAALARSPRISYCRRKENALLA